MRLLEWVQRLQQSTDLVIKRAADLASAEDEHRHDTVYVMYSSDEARSTDAEVIGSVRQEHALGVDVIYAIANFRSPIGENAVDDVELVREPVLEALIGWQPPGTAGAITFRRGRVIGFRKGVLWWHDSFEVPVSRASRGAR